MATPKALLINASYLRDMTIIGDNVMDNVLVNSIRIAQEMKIQPTLGQKLYQKLLDDVVAGSLSGDYETLLDDYIAVCLVQWALYDSVIGINFKMTNKGVVTSNDQYTEAANIETTNYLRNSFQNQAIFYSDRLKNYLCDNKEKYPEYTELADDHDLNPNNEITKYQTGFYGGRRTKNKCCDESGLIII